MTRIMQLSLLAGTIVLSMPTSALAVEDIPPRVLFMAFGGLLFSLAVVAIVHFFAVRAQRQRLELIERYIEKGQEVPSELLAKAVTMSPEKRAISRQRDMRRGCWLLFWGLGFALLGYLSTGQLKSTILGLIFLFLSAGSFVNGLFFSGKPDSDRKQEKDA
jgi:uncharacterized membrane protein YfcA